MATRRWGKVLRALQSHDGRLAEDPLRFVQATSTGGGRSGNGGDPDPQLILDVSDVSQGLYAHVVAASGLGKPGLQVSQDIEYAVRAAARLFEEGDLAGELAGALGLAKEAGARNICTIAALLLANACLLHRRLCEVPGLESLPKLNKVGGASDSAAVLRTAWQAILDRDYAPVFEPPLAVLDALPARRYVGHALRILAECANRVADSLSALGYDHSGPLYHRILPNAQAYGAFYTNNLSALMLARLALDKGFVNWADPKAVSQLRIMDPACGTGTLLMASLHVIKKRLEEEGRGCTDDSHTHGTPDDMWLHQVLVEEVLCGLDVNRHAIQLAACNLTLGAPTVDYRRMNLLTLKHGPQPDGTVRAGSLDILGTADRADSLPALIRPLRTMDGLAAEQVDGSEGTAFPLGDLDVVMMNPPYTSNTHRNRHFGPAVVKRMQRHELDLRDQVLLMDPGAQGVIASNSIGTYFTPLADRLLHKDRGVLAKVIPATACTNASGLAERRFLARRFHIERIITSHDPRRIGFSENTSIHECLLIARRTTHEKHLPTEFVSLRKMPTTPSEALAAADAIASGDAHEWGQIAVWPTERVKAGDWTAVQWFDPQLAVVVGEIEASPHLEPLMQRYALGPSGRRIRDTYEKCDDDAKDAVRLFWSIASHLRRTMHGEPEEWRRPKFGKEALAERYWQQRSTVLVAERYDTVAGRLTALWTAEPSVGSGWTPVSIGNESRAKGLAAWWNSTPARLLLMNQRSRKLTYPKWSLAQLRRIRIPDEANPAWDMLADAWEEVHEKELLPMHQAKDCLVRRIIDAAAATALGVTEQRVADWRRRLANEPTVTNAPATWG